MEFDFRPDREAHLRELCSEMGRSIDDVLNEAVLSFMEDYEDARDADAVCEQGEATVSAEEARKQLGLDARLHAASSEAA